MLKTDDELFVDFIAKCLTWDPDRRLKPLPALRHPWLVKQRLQQQQQLQPQVTSTPSSRLSQQTPQSAGTASSVTGRIASSLTGTGRAKVAAETPKKVRCSVPLAPAPLVSPADQTIPPLRPQTLNIGAPTPLSARVRASNIVGPSTPTAGGGAHSAHASISSTTGSFRQHRASQQPLTTSGSSRHLSVYGVRLSPPPFPPSLPVD